MNNDETGKPEEKKPASAAEILNIMLSDPEKAYITDLTNRLVTEPDIGNFKWSMTDAAALKSIIAFFNGLLDNKVKPHRSGIMCNVFNMNCSAEVTLTRDGLKILVIENQTEYLHNYNQETKVYKTELWQLMETFGSHLCAGMPNGLFKDNSIRLESR